jgi:hypothetical protein
MLQLWLPSLYLFFLLFVFLSYPFETASLFFVNSGEERVLIYHPEITGMISGVVKPA